jgi:hypothetical protein
MSEWKSSIVSEVASEYELQCQSSQAGTEKEDREHNG